MFGWFIVISILWLAFGAFLQSWFDANESMTDRDYTWSMVHWMFLWPIFLLMEFIFWIGSRLIFTVLRIQEYREDRRSKRE